MRNSAKFTRLSFLLLSLIMFGCQSENKDVVTKVSLKGKLVDNGKQWTFDEGKIKFPKGVSMPPGITAGGTSPVQVVFFSDTPGVDAVHCNVNVADGTFTVPAIKPGHYRVAIFLPATSGVGTDPFGNKFTIANTKIVRDIVGGEDLVFDITKPQG